MDGGASRELEASIREESKEDGCAYILDEKATCGGARKPGSSYCERHHALCHLAGGSSKERRRLNEEEALAVAVGGKRGRPARNPPERFLRWLENVARGFPRPKCSCIVPGEDQ